MVEILGRNIWKFLRKPYFLLALVKVFVKFFLKSNLVSRNTKVFSVICPQVSFLVKIYNRVVLHIFFLLFLLLLLKMTYCGCFVGSELKLIYYWNAQLFQFNDQLCMFLTRQKSEVSLTNNFGSDVRLSAKSNHKEFWPFSTTRCFLLFKKSVMTSKVQLNYY